MNRRTFLKTSAFAAAGLLTVPVRGRGGGGGRGAEKNIPA